MKNIKPDFWNALKNALLCTCPRCGEGALFSASTSLNLNEKCPSCAMDLARHDSGDGPAVFLIFWLGFLLVPLALLVEFAVHPPLWVHAAVWTVVALGLTLGMLKPLKSVVIMLQYRYRPGSWQ
jgi:uncharacterized protein (DUF983 family)